MSLLTSVADPLWQRFSAPVKAAIRWASASAAARSSDRFDSVDLVIGIVLADLAASPATLLFDHFDIPLGEVVQRHDVAPPAAGALLAGFSERTDSLLDDDVVLVFQERRRH